MAEKISWVNRVSSFTPNKWSYKLTSPTGWGAPCTTRILIYQLIFISHVSSWIHHQIQHIHCWYVCIYIYIYFFFLTVFFKATKKTHKPWVSFWGRQAKKTSWCFFLSNLTWCYNVCQRTPHVGVGISRFPPPIFLWLQHTKLVLMIDIWCNSKFYKTLTFAA